MNIRSFHRLLLSFLGVILITCCINTFTINAEVPDVEVLIEGLDEEPTTRKIGEYTSNNSVELWHYSGGYWGYKGLKIYDKDLGDDLKNPDSIANAIKDDIEFEIPIDEKLYNSLIEQEDIKIVCSTTLVDEATSKNREITDLFYDKPIIEIKKNKIYFKGRPRFNFYVEEKYDNIIGDKLNVRIPLVDPDYGYNTYAIWGRNEEIEWGGALGYFDKKDPFAFAPVESGMIAPAQIKNADGRLIDGFTFKVGNETKLSNETSIGYYTFKKGGAVGIHFKYPIKFTFYSGEGGEDLEAQFESLPTRAFEGNDVSVVVRVNSTFTTDLKNIPYNLNSTKFGNKILL